MHKDNHNSPLALSYARSLIELATERGQTEAVADEVRGLRQIIDTNPTFEQVLADPGNSEDERAQLIRQIFEGRVSQLMLDFMLLVNQKGRLAELPAIAGAFDDLLDEQNSKVEVDVTVATKLSAEQLESVRDKVSRALGKDAVVHQYIDESIIGGLVLRVQDQLIDGSIRTQLQTMRRRLQTARIK